MLQLLSEMPGGGGNKRNVGQQFSNYTPKKAKNIRHFPVYEGSSSKKERKDQNCHGRGL